MIAYTKKRIRDGGLKAFVKHAWHCVDPNPFRHNWHIDLICDELERLYRGEIKDLVIMVPPGTGKSLLTQVFFPAWVWLQKPSEKFIYATYEANLGKKFARQMRDLINSDWWQARWPDITIPYQNTRSAAFFMNNQRGFRFTTGTGGALTGNHAGILVGDDLNKAQAVLGGAVATMTDLRAAVDFWLRVMPTRRTDPATTRRLLIQQRLHYQDPAGSWIEHDDGVEVLCLPMWFEKNHKHRHPKDKREEGDLLWPAHIPEEAANKLAKDLGPFHSQAQLQQRPGNEGGQVFQIDWLLNQWRSLDIRRNIPGCISCDLTFGSSSDASSYAAIGAWAVVDGKAHLIDVLRKRMSYTETKQALVEFCAKYPSLRPVLIENKANGPAIIDDLRREIHGMVPTEPRGSKVARAHAVTGFFQAQQIVLPHPHLAMLNGRPHPCKWVDDYVGEMIKFSGSPADYDDQVDMTSQAISHLFKGAGSKFVAAMERIAHEVTL